MSVASESGESLSSSAALQRPTLPPQIQRLALREREVATIVYLNGACTAKDVQSLLPVKLSNGAVRSMLVRLVRKGLLERKWGKRGPNQWHVYLPAIAPDDLKERALRDVAEMYFGGSLLSAAMSALTILDNAGELPPQSRAREVRREARVLPFLRNSASQLQT